MKALVIDGGSLVLRELQPPRPAAGELLVRVAMAGVNRADLQLLATHGGANPSGVAGGELTGEVIGIGAGCDGFAIGDRVMALAPAAYAEQAVVDHRVAVRVPVAIDWPTAAALPAWSMTAHDALVTEGGLRAGDAVLVQGATSGVGIAAAQLARLFGAATVIGVARAADKLRRLPALDRWFTADTDWPAAVRDATGGRGVDCIVDMVGGGALVGNLASLALRGRIVAVGRLGGASDALDLQMLATKRARLIGVTFRTRTVEEKAAIARAFEADVLPAVADGRIRPPIDRVFALADAAAAHAHMRRNAHLGKVLLQVGA